LEARALSESVPNVIRINEFLSYPRALIDLERVDIRHCTLYRLLQLRIHNA
jgi:hypothetical protein